MTALKHPSPVSVADYLAGEEIAEVKHEYLGGGLHAMEGGNARHNAISTSAVGALVARLRGKPCQPFNSDMKVRIEHAGPHPVLRSRRDVVYSRGPDAAHCQDHPVVIVEVLSESTRRIDLTEKCDAYLAIGTLKQLILVEPDETRVIVCPRKATTGGIEADEHPGLAALIPLPEIEAELPLAELWERVTF